MKLFEFGDFKREIDATDVDFMKRYEFAFDNYDKNINTVIKETEGRPVSEQFEAMCEVFFKAFDELFGEGASREMFGSRKSVELCAAAVNALIALMSEYGEALKLIQGNPTKPAAPNRAVRRAKK